MKIKKHHKKVEDNIYYDEKTDSCIVIYKDFIVRYFNRIVDCKSGKAPFCFMDSEKFERWEGM